MKKNANPTVKKSKKNLVLRKESIQALDNADLSLVIGGDEPVPPDAGCSRQMG